MGKKIAGTWINLQDAYTVEANFVGSWSQIGYNAPGKANGASSSETNNFVYSDGNVTKSGNTSSVTWTAKTIHKLNDCDANGTWTATANSANNSSDGTTYVAITTGGAPNCVGLTPSFSNLTRSSM